MALWARLGGCPQFDPVDRLSPFAPPVGEMSSVDPARGPPGGGGANSGDLDGIYGE